MLMLERVSTILLIVKVYRHADAGEGKHDAADR